MIYVYTEKTVNINLLYMKIVLQYEVRYSNIVTCWTDESSSIHEKLTSAWWIWKTALGFLYLDSSRSGMAFMDRNPEELHVGEKWTLSHILYLYSNYIILNNYN